MPTIKTINEEGTEVQNPPMERYVEADVVEPVPAGIVAQRQVALARAAQLISLATGLLELAIGLRVFFKFIAANPNSPIVALTYQVTNLFLWPFQGLAPTPATTNGMVFEVSSIVAMVIYAMLSWAVIRLMYILFAPPTA